MDEPNDTEELPDADAGPTADPFSGPFPKTTLFGPLWDAGEEAATIRDGLAEECKARALIEAITTGVANERTTAYAIGLIREHAPGRYDCERWQKAVDLLTQGNAVSRGCIIQFLGATLCDWALIRLQSCTNAALQAQLCKARAEAEAKAKAIDATKATAFDLLAALANRQAGENPAPATPATVDEPEAQPTEAGAAGETAAAMAGTQTSARPLADEQINAMTTQQGITLRDACRVISAAREDSDAGTPEGKKRLRGRIRGRITPIGKEGQTDIFDAWCLFQLLHSLGECPPPNAMMAAAKKKGFIIRRPRPPQN